MTCNEAEGALYAFPRITLPPKAVQEAKRIGGFAFEGYMGFTFKGYMGLHTAYIGSLDPLQHAWRFETVGA